MQFNIRHETSSDVIAIHELTRDAFAPMPFADGNEQDLINALRSGGALALSLVAEFEGEIVGHVALSPVTHESGVTGWFGLGPISVKPDLQCQGIGRALIQHAHNWLVDMKASGCILVGNTDYYSKHGYVKAPDYAPISEPSAHFMIWSNCEKIPNGKFAFHEIFYT